MEVLYTFCYITAEWLFNIEAFNISDYSAKKLCEKKRIFCANLQFKQWQWEETDLSISKISIPLSRVPGNQRGLVVIKSFNEDFERIFKRPIS